ncbi:MAG: hypothetical protein C0601_07410 [Candidatus Muiribacterium halophilum]|uniref:Glycosyltransferase RgtA/B/C/D-like domain-containing protein n=1 Tax=Muiribacterium halophilum TaxID=2053465 RepID=A0A2N5ZG07_MUIH1|nr:MAG: hypothetical protein C0601_07410 [Candidatus Muirbacterium halophilum]
MKKFLLIGFVLIVILKVAFLFFVYSQDKERFFFPDSLTYTRPADQILSHHRFYQHDKPEIFRTPGYPLFIAFSMLFSDNYELILLFMQIILILILSFYIYKKRKLLAIGCLTSIILLLEPRIIVSEFSVLSETLYLFFINIGLFLIIEATKKKTNKRLFIGVILLSLATYIRPVAIFLVPILVVILFLINKVDLKKAGMLFLIHIIILSFWMGRNKVVSDQFIFSSVGGKNLYYYTAAAVLARAENRPYNIVKLEFEKNMLGFSSKEKIKYEKKEAFKILISNPGSTLFVLGKGLMVNIFSPGSELFPQLLGMRKGGSGLVYKFNNLSLLQFFKYLLKEERVLLIAVLPGFLWNIVLLMFFIKNIIKYRKDSIIILGTVFYLYHIVLTAGPAATSRFTAPVVPVMLVIAFYKSRNLG